MGPSLPQECQEPWATLIDTGTVSIAPQPFVPHIPLKQKSPPASASMVEHQGHRCQTCHLDHWQSHHSCELCHCRRHQESNHWSRYNSSQSSSSSSSPKRKCILQQHQRKALLHYYQSHYYASGLVLPDHESHHLRWSDPQFTTLDNQSAFNINAETDDKVISDSRKIILEESQEDLSQQAQVPQCLKVPSTPSAAERAS